MITSYLASGGTGIAETIHSSFNAIGPLGKYVGALVVFLIGNIVAKTLGKTVTQVTSGLDNKLSKYVGRTRRHRSTLSSSPHRHRPRPWRQRCRPSVAR